MKNKILLSLAIMSCFALTACGHEHTLTEATCTEPIKCTECEYTEGTALGHAFVDATCDTAKTCSVCGTTEGTALGHSFTDATCDTAMTCSVCGTIEGNPLEHSWIDATTEAPKTCELCGATEGEPIAKEQTTSCNTVPEEEIQWYLDTLGLTRAEFDQLTDDDLLRLVTEWFNSPDNPDRPGGSSGGSSGGSESGGGNSGGSSGGSESGGGSEDDFDLPPAPLPPSEDILPGNM